MAVMSRLVEDLVATAATAETAVTPVQAVTAVRAAMVLVHASPAPI